MESAAITQRSKRLRPTMHLPMGRKAEEIIPKGENGCCGLGQSPTEEVPSAWVHSLYAPCAPRTLTERSHRLVQQVCRSQRRGKECIKKQGQPSQSASVHRAGLNARSRDDESNDEQEADAFQQYGKRTATVDESRDDAERKRRTAKQ